MAKQVEIVQWHIYGHRLGHCVDSSYRQIQIFVSHVRAIDSLELLLHCLGLTFYSG
jgi:hypothetical protein